MIFTSNLIVTGEIRNIPVYANTMMAASMSNISIESDVNVKGSLFTTKRLDVGYTVYGTFRLSSNIAFGVNQSEIYGTSNAFLIDDTTSDMSAVPSTMSNVKQNIFDPSSGIITVPVSGLYSLQMQGVFQNDSQFIQDNHRNGAYFYFKNYSYCNARMAAVITNDSVISTNYFGFLLQGDQVLPTFYSSDPNAVLLASSGETYVNFTVATTVTPTHSNYIRIPTASN